MKDHFLEFTQPGTSLLKKRGSLAIKTAGAEKEILVPFTDIAGVLILSENLYLSTAVITELLAQDVSIQFLNEKYMPTGLLLPYVSHQLSRKRFLAQLGLSDIQKNRFWQKIVISKIQQQELVLKKLNKNSHLLFKFQQEVTSGDTQNHEAQAARVYWTELFGNDFRRDQESAGLNAFLNYGYAIIRSAIARYCVACGLNPNLGVFHKNMENPFCLIDDLMEPFRPLVDSYCYAFREEKEISPQIKKTLVSILEQIVFYNHEQKTLRNALQEYCQSFTNAVIFADYKIFNMKFDLFYEQS